MGGEKCCAVCKAYYVKQLRRKLIELLEVGKVEFEQGKVRFMTLTYPALWFFGLQKSWARMRTLLHRRYGKSIKFLGVRQVGEQGGKCHLHAFVDRYIPQRLLSDLWREATLGASWVVDIREVKTSDVSSVARYMVSYVSKGLPLPHRVRRYSVAYGLYKLLRELKPKVKEAGWRLVDSRSSPRARKPLEGWVSLNSLRVLCASGP